MTGGDNDDGVGDGATISWSVDPERRLVQVVLNGGVSDRDMISILPQVWERHPEVIHCSTFVDARRLTSEGAYSWRGMQELARRWRAFAGARSRGRRTAIVSTDYVYMKIIEIVALGYPGQKLRVFSDENSALEWFGVE